MVSKTMISKAFAGFPWETEPGGASG